MTPEYFYQLMKTLLPVSVIEDVQLDYLIRAFAQGLYQASIKSPNFGRPVTIMDAKNQKGKFHFWGNKVIYRSSDPRKVTYETTAIIELEDGRIVSKKPELIKFINEN